MPVLQASGHRNVEMIPEELSSGREFLPSIASCIPVFNRDDANDSLYKHLELRVLIDKVSNRLQKSHSIESVRFRALNFPFSAEHNISRARPSVFELRFALNHQNRTLGILTLGRSFRFSAHEFAVLASEVGALGGPCNNALLYARACHLAEHDELTGLSNRSALKLSQLSTAANRTHKPFVLLICDIDEFKLINDLYGHSAGDAVLRQFAAKLQSIVGNDEIVFRYGGDEFVIAFSNINSFAGLELAEKIRRTIQSDDFLVDGVWIDVTTTIGVTLWRQGEILKTALGRADKALLHGKKTGRNKVVWK